MPYMNDFIDLVADYAEEFHKNSPITFKELRPIIKKYELIFHETTGQKWNAYVFRYLDEVYKGTYPNFDLKKNIQVWRKSRKKG